jgi:hypothetical protein
VRRPAHAARSLQTLGAMADHPIRAASDEPPVQEPEDSPAEEPPARAPAIQDPPFEAPWPGAPIREPDRLA